MEETEDSILDIFFLALKRCSEKLKSTFFSLLPWAAQMAQREEFMFQNVAYRLTVHWTGVKPHVNVKFQS